MAKAAANQGGLNMKQVFTAKTVDEAKALAAEEFGVSAEKIAFTVLEEPKKTLFGMKGEAKVEAEYEMSKPEIAADYIVTVMRCMGYDPTVEISEIEGGSLLEIKGDGVEGIIGRRGETLDSLQYLASLVANRNDRNYYRIATDCCGFRDKRKVQLEELAGKMVAKAKRTGRTVALEPMNPYERRIIHAAVSQIENASSRSVGEEPYRKVLITCNDPDRPRYSHRNGDYKGGRNGNRRNGRRREDFKARSLDITSSFEKDYKKPKPEDEMGSTGLYSKIEF